MKYWVFAVVILLALSLGAEEMSWKKNWEAGRYNDIQWDFAYQWDYNTLVLSQQYTDGGLTPSTGVNTGLTNFFEIRKHRFSADYYQLKPLYLGAEFAVYDWQDLHFNTDGILQDESSFYYNSASLMLRAFNLQRYYYFLLYYSHALSQPDLRPFLENIDWVESASESHAGVHYAGRLPLFDTIMSLHFNASHQFIDLDKLQHSLSLDWVFNFTHYSCGKLSYIYTYEESGRQEDFVQFYLNLWFYENIGVNFSYLRNLYQSGQFPGDTIELGVFYQLR